MARTDVNKVKMLMNYSDLNSIPLSLISMMIERSHIEVQNIIDDRYENSTDENLVHAESELTVYHIFISMADRTTLMYKSISLGNKKVVPSKSSVEDLILISNIHKDNAAKLLRPFMVSYGRVLISVTESAG
jgi:hypothetical protein